MAYGAVQEVNDGLTAVDHEPISKLHGLGTLTTQLARHDHLTALGSALHDKLEHSVARSAYTAMQ